MLIEKRLTGELLETQPEAETETLTDNVWSENPKRKLRWELPVEAGATLRLTYRYKVYVRR